MIPTALTEMVDRVVDDRYRIDALIGHGEISAVFVAYDKVDDRQVALKLFAAVLADDEAFVERLLDAVEQAAALTHPGIAEIYDWGVDDGPYIVSELCEGGSLAALLAEGHRLEANQALVVALECTRALNHGHEQGAIHRNLTPRNLLFTADQQVRITDYGLSKVLSNVSAVQALRALENVRYASPEQARGRPITESTDMYSLALVMSEAVSGIAPEVADTVVGTLMDRAESPARLDPALGDLLLPLERCGRVEADQRPEAEELAIALLATAETMPRPQVLPIVGIDYGDGEAGADRLMADGEIDVLSADAAPLVPGEASEPDAALISADTGDGPAPETGEMILPVEPDESADVHSAQPETAGESPTASIEPATSVLGSLENLEQAEPVFAEIPSVEIETTLDVPESTPTGRSRAAYEELEDDAEDRLPWWPLVALALLIAGAAAAAVYFLALDESADVAVAPDVVGLQFEELDQFDSNAWQVTRLETRLDGAAIGSVVAQRPEPGDEIDPAQGLVVTVVIGNQMVDIPSDIVGLTVEQAESRLGTVGLGLGRLSQESSEDFAAGLVIGLDEPTTQTPRGDGVDLRVSAGPEDRVVPDGVVGLMIGDATSLLVGLRLQAIEEPAFHPEAEVGTVLASIPPAGAVVPADSAVTLIVSAGPEPVEMPDIVGLQLAEAIDAVEELGLVWIDTTGTVGEEVIGSLPPIGAIVDVGTEVTIILADPVDEDGDG